VPFVLSRESHGSRTVVPSTSQSQSPRLVLSGLYLPAPRAAPSCTRPLLAAFLGLLPPILPCNHTLPIYPPAPARSLASCPVPRCASFQRCRGLAALDCSSAAAQGKKGPQRGELRRDGLERLRLRRRGRGERAGAEPGPPRILLQTVRQACRCVRRVSLTLSASFLLVQESRMHSSFVWFDRPSSCLVWFQCWIRRMEEGAALLLLLLEPRGPADSRRGKRTSNLMKNCCVLLVSFRIRHASGKTKCSFHGV
jgi:hypothetical protein